MSDLSNNRAPMIEHSICMMASLTLLALVGCGGGSGSSSGGSSVGSITQGPVGAAFTGDLVYNACESSYYDGIIGTYQGDVEYRFEQDGVLRHHCVFDVEIQIAGTPDIGPTPDTSRGCFLTGSVSGSVEEIVNTTVELGTAGECRATTGGLSISDPNASVINPEVFYENVSYPVSIRAAGPLVDAIGQSTANSDLVARYIYLFGSSTGVSNRLLVNGDGELDVVLGGESVSDVGVELQSDVFKTE